MQRPPAKAAQSEQMLPFRSQAIPDPSTPSNLTFGAGGKDKDGKSIAGWGYYEVSSSIVFNSISSECVNLDNCWRLWRGPYVAWHGWRPYAHHEHSDRRC